MKFQDCIPEFQKQIQISIGLIMGRKMNVGGLTEVDPKLTATENAYKIINRR